MKLPSWAKEHPWVSGLSVLLASLALVELALLLHLRGTHETAVRQRDSLKAMERVGVEYSRVARRDGTDHENGVVLLSPNSGFGPADVDRVAKDNGIADRVGAVTVNRARVDERVEKQVISLTLTSVTSKQLALFLRAIEQIDPAVGTRELRISASPKAPSLVDAKVQMTAPVLRPALSGATEGGYEAATRTSR